MSINQMYNQPSAHTAVIKRLGGAQFSGALSNTHHTSNGPAKQTAFLSSTNVSKAADEDKPDAWANSHNCIDITQHAILDGEALHANGNRFV